MIENPIYLDHSATTPVDPLVIEAMIPYWTEGYGNPSSVHHFGRIAKQGLETARRSIANLLNCKPAELIFTGCGSESDNLAVKGVMMAARAAGRGNHLVTSIVEHEAVLHTAEHLRDVHGFELTILGVDQFGRVDPQAVADALRPDTVLVSIMAANNEVGTIQPISEIGQIARQHGALFHTDAIQAANLMEWDMQTMPIDLLSLAPHKFYGPKGVGLLYAKTGIDMEPVIIGGGQENGRRAGTVNVPFAVGAAKALELAVKDRLSYIEHVTDLRDRLISGITAAFPGDEVTLTGHPTERLPHHASFAFKNLNGNDLIIQLDALGVSSSSGSACSSGNPKPSAILQAMGYAPEWCIGGLRLTVGKQNNKAEIDYLIKQMPESISRLQRFSELARG
ncbi:MAG: cysteine desulfurase family protein [Ardenticatenaceae bacterium]|nr:cysteine desulfurase family protein [Ardenticatenaceae bacterium]